jgi:hypothetical protein
MSRGPPPFSTQKFGRKKPRTGQKRGISRFIEPAGSPPFRWTCRHGWPGPRLSCQKMQELSHRHVLFGGHLPAGTVAVEAAQPAHPGDVHVDARAIADMTWAERARHRGRQAPHDLRAIRGGHPASEPQGQAGAQLLEIRRPENAPRARDSISQRNHARPSVTPSAGNA